MNYQNKKPLCGDPQGSVVGSLLFDSIQFSCFIQRQFTTHHLKTLHKKNNINVSY